MINSLFWDPICARPCFPLCFSVILKLHVLVVRHGGQACVGHNHDFPLQNLCLATLTLLYVGRHVYSCIRTLSGATAASDTSASFISFSISSLVIWLCSAFRVFLVPPSAMTLLWVFILLTRFLSVSLIFPHALTPTSPTLVGPPNETQLFIWKSLSLYDSELWACLMLAPLFVDRNSTVISNWSDRQLYSRIIKRGVRVECLNRLIPTRILPQQYRPSRVFLKHQQYWYWELQCEAEYKAWSWSKPLKHKWSLSWLRFWRKRKTLMP